MNQATRTSQNLIKGRIWPLGQTLDMPDLGYELGSGLIRVSKPDVEPGQK